MSRLLLCSAIAAFFALATAAQAHHHHYHVHRRIVGFLDYRHSLDDDGRSSSDLDARREYVFHHMKGREASEYWRGGDQGRRYTHRHDHGGCNKNETHAISSHHYHGGGHHNHAWGIHSSDYAENH